MNFLADLLKYNSKLDPVVQVDTEEDISSVLFDKFNNHEPSEELCNEMGRLILKGILFKFRPDLFTKEEPDGQAQEEVEKAGDPNRQA